MSVRFAPSPTGTFHIGNLRTAWISLQWSQALNWPWIVRFEDIDTARVLQGAQEKQLEDMRELGLEPSRIDLQSTHRTRHWELFLRAIKEGQAYPCNCTRKDLRTALDQMASAPHQAAPLYTGHCRKHQPETTRGLPGVAWRFRNEAADGSQDFIIARTQDLEPDLDTFAPSYHWACAIDDIDGKFILLVRAWDLEDSAFYQRAVQKWICQIENKKVGLPAIYHTALLVQNDGTRLEKRTKGVTLSELKARGFLCEKIQRTFEQSFHFKKSEFAPGRLWGETNRQLRLEELINREGSFA